MFRLKRHDLAQHLKIGAIQTEIIGSLIKREQQRQLSRVDGRFDVVVVVAYVLYWRYFETKLVAGKNVLASPQRIVHLARSDLFMHLQVHYNELIKKYARFIIYVFLIALL